MAQLDKSSASPGYTGEMTADQSKWVDKLEHELGVPAAILNKIKADYKAGAGKTVQEGSFTTQPSAIAAQNKQMLADQLAARQQQGLNYQTQQGLGQQQQQYINALQAQAQGQGPSLAQGQFQQNLDQAIAAQRSMAASGGDPALAARQAAMQGGQMTQAAAGQAGQLRLQEQLGAQQQLGQALVQARAGETGMQQMMLGEQQQMDQMTQFYLTQGMSQDQARIAAAQQLEMMRQEANIATMNAQAQVAAAEASKQGEAIPLIGAGISAAGSVGAALL